MTYVHFTKSEFSLRKEVGKEGTILHKILAASKYNSIYIYLAREELNWGSPHVPNVATEKKRIMNKDQIAK